jgi:hypothetical protein
MITTQLILNETTLFWYNISSMKTGKTKYGLIANWAAQVRKHSKIHVTILLSQVHPDRLLKPNPWNLDIQVWIC